MSGSMRTHIKSGTFKVLMLQISTSLSILLFCAIGVIKSSLTLLTDKKFDVCTVDCC